MKKESPTPVPLPLHEEETQPVPLPGVRRRGRANRRKILTGIGIALVLAVLSVFGARRIAFALSHEETDDAQVEGDISPVLPRVSGYVTRVLVTDNQAVKEGQPLAEIDTRELELRIAEAEAARQSAESALENARAVLGNAEAAEAVAQANVATAAVSAAKTAADLARDRRLFATQAITDRELTDSKAAADLAGTRLEAARKQAAAAGTQIAVARAGIGAAEAQVRQREADLAYARLERSYGTVTSPLSGLVSRKSIEPGQFVQAGQTLMSIASNHGLWVVANFKETQIGRMRRGQPAEVKIDGYPGRVFHGRVDSLSEATGARFALLPPDNASGNFVKVTQRVPVKIVLTDAPDPAHPLRIGMSVDSAVLVKD